MFNLKNNNPNKELSNDDRDLFDTILKSLHKSLSNTNLYAQINVIRKLISLNTNKDNEQFVKLLNGIEMWGGSGAVWEVYIENKNTALEFEISMIELIDLMDKCKILKKGIKPIRKIFLQNVKQ